MLSRPGRGQLVTGVVLLLFGLFVCWQAASLSVGDLNRPGPGFFPIVLGALLVVLAVWIFVEARLLGRELAPSTSEASAGFGQVALVSGLIVAFAFLLEPLGYVVGMLVLMVLLLRVAGRGWRLSALLATASTLLTYVLFDTLLGIPLPEGFLAALQ